jgi:hypothetical protein
MAFTTAVRESAALNVTGQGNWVSLHTADPGTTGASEATGGSPAYARKQTTWSGGASDGSVTGSQVEFDAPAGTYPWAGVWTAQTGGTFLGGLQLSSSAVLAAQGLVRVTPTINAA